MKSLRELLRDRRELEEKEKEPNLSNQDAVVAQLVENARKIWLQNEHTLGFVGVTSKAFTDGLQHLLTNHKLMTEATIRGELGKLEAYNSILQSLE